MIATYVVFHEDFFLLFKRYLELEKINVPFHHRIFFIFHRAEKNEILEDFFPRGWKNPTKTGKEFGIEWKKVFSIWKKFHFLVATVDLHINAMSSMYFLLLGAGKIIMWTKQLSFLICEKKSVPSFVWSNAYGNKNWSLTQWICIILD